MFKQYIWALLLVAVLASAAICRAQSDYDDDGYGNQGGNSGGNQGDNDGYQNNYDDGYSNAPNGYQQNVDPESSNNNPSSYSTQGGSDADGDYDGDDGSAAAAASSVHPTVVRVRRSVGADEPIKAEASVGKLRVKRHGKYYIGPVYTYVKTDKHANFKWGVKHKVGKKHWG